jgi:hypothetical protein
MENGNYTADDLARLAVSIREEHKQTPIQIYMSFKKDCVRRWIAILSMETLPERTDLWIPGKKEDEILYRQFLEKDRFKVESCSRPSDKMFIFTVKTPGLKE